MTPHSKRIWTFTGIGLVCGALSAQVVMSLGGLMDAPSGCEIGGGACGSLRVESLAAVVLVLLHGMMMALLLAHLSAQPQRRALSIVLLYLWPVMEIAACLFAGLIMSVLAGVVLSFKDMFANRMIPYFVIFPVVPTPGALAGGAVLALVAWFILRTRRVWIFVPTAGLVVWTLFLICKLAELSPLLSEWLFATLFCALSFSLFAAIAAWCRPAPVGGRLAGQQAV